MSSTASINAVITADDKASKAIAGVGDNVDKMANKIGLAMTAAGAGLMLLTKNAVDFTKDLAINTHTLQQQTGLTAQHASELLFVTNRMGISAEEASQSFGIFSKNILKTAQSSDTSTTALGQLGVTVRDADGTTRSFNDILLQTADKFKQMPDGAQKTATAMALFGRSGKDMIPVLNLGSQGIKDLEAQADKLGLTLNSSSVAAIYKYITAQRDLKASTDAVKVQVGVLTAPVLTAFNTQLNHVVTTLSQTHGPLKNMAAGTIALGGPMLTAAGGAVSFAANFKQIGVSVGTAASALGRFGLIGVAVGAIVGALAFTIGQYHRAHDAATGAVHTHDQASKDLNSTLNQQVTSLHDVTAAQHDSTLAHLDATGAALDLERAQKDYNNAVRDYGPASFEARDAAYNLARAKQSLSDAQQREADTQATANQKEQEFNMQTGPTVGAINIRAGALMGIALNADVALTHVANLDLGIRNADSHIGDLVQHSQRAAGSINYGGVTGVPLRAAGGPVKGQSPYIVGEEGPELFVPGNSGTIVPNDKLHKPTPGGSVGGPSSVNITIQAGAFMGSQQDARKYAVMIMSAWKDAMSIKGVPA